MDQEIDLHAIAKGDMSVGLPDCHWIIQNIGPLDLYDEQREQVREDFQRAFERLCGEKVRVTFSDEPTN